MLKGVPQGSVLGPVLFNIFINDLAYSISGGSLINYADDNTLTAHADNMPELQHILTSETNNILEWFKLNHMKANPSKFQTISVGADKNSKLSVTINNTDIKECDECVKLVGVYIDKQLNFTKHIKEICIKAGRQLNVLKRLSSKLDKESRLCIFRCFVLSHFNYCPIAWHFCSKANTIKLEKLQQRGLRFVYNDYTSDYEQLLAKASLPTLELGRLRNICTEMYKAINGHSPNYICNLFQEKTTHYSLRDPLNIHIPRPKTTKFGKHSFRYFGSHLWNNLPSQIKQSKDINTFKNLIKSWTGPSCKCNFCKY
jgi:ribonuclease P/MRP protein subunit RPP40